MAGSGVIHHILASSRAVMVGYAFAHSPYVLFLRHKTVRRNHHPHRQRGQADVNRLVYDVTSKPSGTIRVGSEGQEVGIGASEERFVGGRVWATLTNAAKRSSGQSYIAVAYFGKGAARLLPLTRGSYLVVDASDMAVKSGQTKLPSGLLSQ